MPVFFFSGSTHHERHAVTSLVADAISAAGWVLGHTQFSNMTLAIHFEMAPNRVSRMLAELDKLPVALSQETERRLAELVARERREPYRTEPFLDCWFHLVFVHKEPDLKITVPAVPG